MRRKKNGFRMVGIAWITFCIAGCGSTQTIQKDIELLTPVEVVVDIETVMNRDLYKVTTKEAELAPYTEELSFEANGKISKLYVELGSVVKKGELLAELEEEGIRNDASSALNKYLSEKKKYMDVVKEAKKKLDGTLSRDDREWQELLVAQAEDLWQAQEDDLWNAWEAARERLGKNKLVAPFDGVVTAYLQEGVTVATGQPVLALADMERICITMGSYLPASELQNYERVYGIVNGKETNLIYMDDMLEEEKNYTYFTAEDFNGAKMGDFVLVCMIGNYHPQVLSVPNSAVYRDSNGTYVYLIENEVRVRRDVVTGYSDDVYVEILEGVKEGDRVYVKN